MAGATAKGAVQVEKEKGREMLEFEGKTEERRKSFVLIRLPHRPQEKTGGHSDTTHSCVDKLHDLCHENFFFWTGDMFHKFAKDNNAQPLFGVPINTGDFHMFSMCDLFWQ